MIAKAVLDIHSRAFICHQRVNRAALLGPANQNPHQGVRHWSLPSIWRPEEDQIVQDGGWFMLPSPAPPQKTAQANDIPWLVGCINLTSVQHFLGRLERRLSSIVVHINQMAVGHIQTWQAVVTMEFPGNIIWTVQPGLIQASQHLKLTVGPSNWSMRQE